MLLLIFNHVDIYFADKKLFEKSYTTEKTLSISYKVEFINKKKLAQVILDEKIKAFILHVALLTLIIIIFLACKTKILLRIIEKVIDIVKYADFLTSF